MLIMLIVHTKDYKTISVNVLLVSILITLNKPSIIL